MSDQVKSFTTEANGIANQLITPCGISLPFNLKDAQTSDIKQFNAIWDTGATQSVITAKVANDLNLKPTGKTIVQHADGHSTVNTYKVNLYLPNQVAFLFITVSEGKLGGDVEILVGMDIIAAGDFAVTNFGGKTVFTYRYPSQERIDFVSGHRNSAEPLKSVHIGRNDPCHCGSGKKYKRCHGRGQ